MKKLLVLLLSMVFVFCLVACGDDETVDSDNITSGSKPANVEDTNPSDSEDSNVSDVPPTNNSQTGATDTNNKPQVNPNPTPGGDVVTPPSNVVTTVEAALGNKLNVFTAKDTFGNEGKVSTYSDYVNVDVSKVAVNKSYQITQSGIYRIYGTSGNGQIYVKAKDQNVILLLDGVNLTYQGSAPVIYAEDCKSVTIILAEGSQNYLADSNTNGENGAIRVRSCNLTMGGKGSLTIKANKKHGISNTKELTINGGSYNITSVGHGIYGKQKITINGGKYSIYSARSAFKSGDNEVGNEYIGSITVNSASIYAKCNTNGFNSYGTVDIINGKITVYADGKGIKATKNVNIKGGTMIFSTKEDAINSELDVTVSGSANIKMTSNGNGIEAQNLSVTTTGVIYIQTMALFSESEAGEFKFVNGSYVLLDGTEASGIKKYTYRECKGFEISNKLTVSNGTIGVDSYEDCFNAKDIEAKGGSMVFATTKDGMDASNTVVVTDNANVSVISSDKGIKAATSVALNAGKTSITATTDAIKSATVTVNGGTHILFDKVEVTSSLSVRDGTLLIISTTNAPVNAQMYLPAASGIIANKERCTVGKKIKISMGLAVQEVVLPKDYTEKMCIFYSADGAGDCHLIIGENEAVETLTKVN